MLDNSELLSKHFAGETTPDEERQVEQFKLNNPEEYKALQTFWTKKEIEVTEFDTTKAWKEITGKQTPVKQLTPYVYLRRIAAAAAILILATTGIYYLNNEQASPKIVETTTKQQKDIIKLEDGTVVHLNKNSTISFPENFATDKREVTLNGEAFFEVAKETNRPFVIRTNHSDVEVLGTSFNINTKQEQTAVSVATGKVKVQSLSNQKSAILIPDQSALVTKEDLETFPTKNKNYLTWKTGVFHFEKAELKQVVNELNGHFGNKITLSNSKSDCLLSTSFKQRELTEILEIIQLTCGLKLTQKNGNYVLQ